MTIAKAPLAIDGVLTPSAQIRKGMMAAIGGGGVRGLNDFRVTATVPNGQSLQVNAGLASVPNGYQPNPDEVYVVSNPTGYQVPSSDMPAASGGTAYWMVALVVGDPTFTNSGHPFMPATFDNEQLNTFQFNRIVLLPCSSTTSTFEQLGKNYPGLALARLAIPAQTTTISDSMITDLRTILRSTAPAGPLSRYWLPNQNIGLEIGNGATANIAVTPIGSPPVGARKAKVKASITARSAGNQQVSYVLQISTNNGASWTDVDYIGALNAGDPHMPMGGALFGEVAVTASSLLYVRVIATVGGGGQSVFIGTSNVTVTCHA